MRKALSLCCFAIILFSLGCGHPTQLQSVSISPSSVTFTEAVPGMTAQLTAYGTFIHPAETRDITSDVTWSSSVTDIAIVDATGKVTTVGLACGITTITATAKSDLVGAGGSGSIMTGVSTIDVKLAGVANCP
jgi:hypothetical protein